MSLWPVCVLLAVLGQQCFFCFVRCWCVESCSIFHSADEQWHYYIVVLLLELFLLLFVHFNQELFSLNLPNTVRTQCFLEDVNVWWLCTQAEGI